MGLQVLSVRKLHKIEEATGLSVVRAVVNNSFHWRIWQFTTPSHQHGWLDISSGDWGWREEGTFSHWSSCAQLDGREERDASRWSTCHRGDEHLTG